MKKTVFFAAVACVLCVIVRAQPKADAAMCNVSFGAVCGYFNNTVGSADTNVLPNGIRGIKTSNSNTVNANIFINDIEGYLYSGDPQSVHGAAFIIDNMLSYQGATGGNPAGGGITAGVKYAMANKTTWETLIHQFANANQVNWSYDPGTAHFCSGKAEGPPSQQIRDSAYDASLDVGDDVFYPVTKTIIYPPGYPSGIEQCLYAYLESEPEISFFWNGGSFNIGTLCGNIQDNIGSVPPLNHLPTGSIQLTCNLGTGLYTATGTFGDLDSSGSDPVRAYIGLNGYSSSPPYSSSTTSGSYSLSIPSSWIKNPYSPQTASVYVEDVGPLGDHGWHVEASSTAPSCVTVSCKPLPPTVPYPLDPFMQFSISVSVGSTSSTPPPSPQMSITVQRPDGTTVKNVTQAITWSVSGTTGMATSSLSNLGPINQTGMGSVKWSLLSNGTTLNSCSDQYPIINLPYLNVYGGDVMTGASPVPGTTCTVNNAAGVYSWNKYGSGYAGAGAEYAVQALAQIEEFGSAMNPSNSSPPLDLSFANSALPAGKVSPGQGLFGGFFGDSSGSWACSSDFTKGLGSPISGVAATNQIASLLPMPSTSPAIINDGSQLRIYANGNVYISRDIEYQLVGWNNAARIPLFELVVTGGNIYIDSSVTQLDGIYIAEPSGGKGGQIIDCASSAGGLWKQVDPTVNGFYATCNHKLTINGAFVAKQVLFGRTSGSLGQATASDTLSSNHDAEVFNYTPEIWLPRSATAPTDAYDAITALPPIL